MIYPLKYIKIDIKDIVSLADNFMKMVLVDNRAGSSTLGTLMIKNITLLTNISKIAREFPLNAFLNSFKLTFYTFSMPSLSSLSAMFVHSKEY